MDKDTTASTPGPSAFDPDEVLQHLDGLVSRDKGSPLSAAARAEMSATLRLAAQTSMAPYAFSLVSRDVTVLWAKLRGGPVTDSQNPDAADLEPLNRCLAKLIEVITRYQGTIDQLSGDAIKVFFGAENPRSDDVQLGHAGAPADPDQAQQAEHQDDQGHQDLDQRGAALSGGAAGEGVAPGHEQSPTVLEGRPLRPIVMQRGVTPLMSVPGLTVNLVAAVVMRPSRP